MSVGYIAAALALVWVITFSLRAAPFVVLRKVRSSRVVAYLGEAMPAGVMLILIVFTLKDVSPFVPAQWVPAVVGVAVTALLHWWQRNVVLSLLGGTITFGVLLTLLA